MSNYQLPEGYKQTEVGVIPVDWRVEKISFLTSITTGGRNTQDRVDDGKYPFFVRSQTVEKINSYSFDGEAVLTAGDGVGTGKIFHYINGKFDIHQRVYKISHFKPELNDFFFYKYFSNYFYDRIMSMTAKSSVDSVRMKMIADMLVPLPKPKEQQSIAQALFDVDALIAALDKLIAKNRDLKTATMQQLLTGKKRLAGFGEGQGYKESVIGLIPEDWDCKEIREFTDCTAGGTPSTLIDSYWGGNIKWMSSGELHQKVLRDVEGRITEKGLKNSSTKIVPPNCVLIGLAGQGKTRGTVAINEVELCTNQSIAAIYPSQYFDSKYLLYNLDDRHEELRGLSTGDGGRGGLNLRIIRSILLPFPTIEEQSAIALVLSDMDNTISLLESRFAKTKAIKQGMMQELLTGRIRLKIEK